MSTRRAAADTPAESIRIGPEDPAYRAVVDKRSNKRFVATPDYVRLVGSTDQVVSAVQEAVSEGRRLAVTSGGRQSCRGGTRIGDGPSVAYSVPPYWRRGDGVWLRSPVTCSRC